MRFVPLWAARLVRRYVQWQERRVKHRSIEMCLEDLAAWRGEPRLPEGVEVVPLGAVGDEWLLRDVYNEAAQDSVGFRYARVADMVAFAASPRHNLDDIFLIRAGERFVGTCVARVRGDGTGGIYSMSIHPDFRRKGIARALLRHALLYLQARGVSRVYLWAHPDNARAISLYLTEGFQIARSPGPTATAKGSEEPHAGRRSSESLPRREARLPITQPRLRACRQPLRMV